MMKTRSQNFVSEPISPEQKTICDENQLIRSRDLNDPSQPSRRGATTRRQALGMIGVAAVLGCRGTAFSAVGIDTAEPKNTHEPGDEALDEALERLHSQEPRCRQGLSTHAPMVAEALCALGRADQAVPWIRNYNAPIRQLPTPSLRIEREQWRSALGPRIGIASWEEANSRWGDWKEFFTAELGENRWQDVLEVWLPRFAPGMCGAATHGVIRTAHAVRALGRRETPARRGELARGLAYWASSYEELPSGGGKNARFETFADALADVPLYWEAFGKSPEGRNIVEALRHVRELDRFAEVRDLIAEPTDLSAAISALTATFARVYLRHGTKHDAIAFVHAVTGPCALRRVAPFVRLKTAQAALPYAWQTAAAIYSGYARDRDVRRPEESKLTPDELALRAIKSGDEHAIKFTEVMIAEHKLNPDPAYLAAAEDAIKRL